MLKHLRDLKLNYDLLKNKATYNKDNEHVKIMFLGSYSHGKSSLIGRLLMNTGSVDEKLWKNYIEAFESLTKKYDDDAIDKLNAGEKPYSWLSDLFINDRVNFSSSCVSQSTINIGNKRISVFDTPIYNLRILRNYRLMDHLFLVIECNYKNFIERIEFITFTLSLQIINNSNIIHVVFTKIDLKEDYDKEISLCVSDLKDILEKQFKITEDVLKIFAVSAFDNTNLINIKEKEKDEDKESKENDNQNHNNTSKYPNLIDYLAQLSKRLKKNTSKCEIELINKPKLKGVVDGKLVVNFISNVENMIKGLVTQGTIKVKSKFNCIPHTKIQGIIESIQINYQNVDQAEEGDYVSIKFSYTCEYPTKVNQILHISNTKDLYSKRVEVKKLIIIYEHSYNEYININSIITINLLYDNLTAKIVRIKDKIEKDMIFSKRTYEIECLIFPYYNKNTFDILENHKDNDVVYLFNGIQIYGKGKIKTIIYE